MREVIPELLWIGRAADAQNVRAVLNLGIAAVVDLAMDELPVAYPRDIAYCRFPLVDAAGNRPGVLLAAVETTARFVEDKIPTLVWCGAGMSRSPAVVAAALSRVGDESPDAALQRVTQSGPHDVSPSLWAEVKRLVED